LVKHNSVTANGALRGEGTFGFDNTNVFVAAAGSTNVEEITALEGMRMFPNPVANDMTLELNFDSNMSFNLSVVDVLGKTMKDLGRHQGDISETFNFSDLPSGLYFLRVTTETEQNLYKFNKI